MLVLTRKEGQVINIGEHIKIKIVELGSGFVKIGIEAPKEMPIFREELYERLKQLNVEASKLNLERLRNFLDMKKEGDKE